MTRKIEIAQVEDEHGKIVSNTISRFGYREVHIVRYEHAVDAGYWIERVCPDFARDLITLWPWVENGVQLHHLAITWNARQLVEFDPEYQSPLKYGVLWWINRGETMSLAIDLAATHYHRLLGRMPSTAWVKEIPEKAAEFVEVVDGDCMMRVELEKGTWLPASRFVVVGCRIEEFDPVWKDGKYV